MGTHPYIGPDAFPRQGRYLGRRATVCFHYDTSHTFEATVVRDDAEDPGRRSSRTRGVCRSSPPSGSRPVAPSSSEPG